MDKLLSALSRRLLKLQSCCWHWWYKDLTNLPDMHRYAATRHIRRSIVWALNAVNKWLLQWLHQRSLNKFLPWATTSGLFDGK
jgi:hypothetical protein